MGDYRVNDRRKGLLEMRLHSNESRQIWWRSARLVTVAWFREYPLETHRPQTTRARLWRWVLGG